MRLHSRQGIIVTSLGEGTQSSRFYRNLTRDEVTWSSRSRVRNRTAGKPGSLDEVTSWSRSQGKQRKEVKNGNKGADNRTEGNNYTKGEGVKAHEGMT